jgi:hypothetical protein
MPKRFRSKAGSDSSFFSSALCRLRPALVFLLQKKNAVAYSAHPRRQNPVACTLIYSGERMNDKLNTCSATAGADDGQR